MESVTGVRSVNYSTSPQPLSTITVDFSHPLPRLLPEARALVTELHFQYCDVPQDFTPQDYPNLEELTILSSDFNREVDLRGLKSLKLFQIDYCNHFNSPILLEDNPSLVTLDISACSVYYQTLQLHDLPNLKQVFLTFLATGDGRPFVPPIKMDSRNHFSTSSVPESGALSDEDTVDTNDFIALFISNCPQLSQLVLQGYVTEEDIHMIERDTVRVCGWMKPPSSVKEQIMQNPAANLAQPDGIALAEAIQAKLR